ncbi:MAG TPA: PA14 domain-containing protein [Cyclobacteriaceae bacterium]|nr:PA14 domain-containing protein [Cyclobacteriaceae bacterium]
MRWIFVGVLACLFSLSASAQVASKVFSLDHSHRELRNGTIDPVRCPNPPDCHARPSASHDSGYTGPFKEGSYIGRNAGGTTIEFMNWRMLYPPGYNAANPTKYPMIIMLHGAGEGGRVWTNNFNYTPDSVSYDNNGRNIIHGGAEHLAAVNRNPSLSNSFPGIVIWPQSSYNGAWDSGWENGNQSDNVRMAAEIIEYMIRERNVDPDRVVMHGLSNGAQGVWDLAAKRSDLFAAIVPMSGVGTNVPEMVNRLVTMPIWIFQGGTDSNPNPTASLEWTNAFNAAGGNMTRTLYPNIGHGTWYGAYAEPNFFPWIKARTKKDIHVFGGSAQVCPGGTLKLGFSDNFLAYQWTKDGADIPGATTRYYGVTAAGAYRVKYQRRTDSSWDISNPTNVIASSGNGITPVLTNTGSTAIPVLGTNGANLPGVKNFVYLRAPLGFSSYQWYKNGSLVETNTSYERLVSQDAGTAANAGTYTVKIVSGGCPSNFSNPVVLTWTSPQPTTPAMAKPNATSLSPTSLNVTWADHGSEVLYELWRYRHTLTYGEQPWSLVTTLPANTTSYVDTGLRPQAYYKYTVRAVLANGSAIISPEGPDSWGRPAADNIPPTAPSSLAVTNITDVSLTLSWLPSTDNDQVYKYEVYNGSTLLQTVTGNINGTPATPSTVNLTGLAPATTYFLNVRGIDFTGNVSPFAEGITATTAGPMNGVAYKFYTFTGTMPGNADAQLVEPRANNSFDFSQTPAKTGTVATFDISPRTQDDLFVFAFDAYIEILTAGNYTFYTSSDDGSRLYVNGVLVVENDNAHGTTEVASSPVSLTPGKYPIRATFFEQGGGEVLTVSYAGPSISKQIIPAARLYLNGTTITTYYSKSSGDLASLGTWGPNTDGSGTAPGNFTATNATYTIANRSSATLTSPWTVSGSGSKVVVGTGSAITLDINAAFTGPMDGKALVTINVNTPTSPQFGVLAANSTVNFNPGANLVIPNAMYGNVNLVSPNQFTIPTSNTMVQGNLSIGNGVTTTGVATNTSRLVVAGNVTFSNSSNPLPGTPANQYSIVFTGGAIHTMSFNTPVDPAFFSIQADVNDVVNFVNAGVHTYTVGGPNGGGIINKGTINIGGNTLIVSGRGTINANNETGVLGINGGSLTLSSTATQHSNLAFDATDNVISNLSVSLPANYNTTLASRAVVNNLVTVAGGGNMVTGDGNLKLTSTQSGTARIGPLANGSRISGSIITQRFMEGEGAIFRYISMPVKGVKVADLQNFFPVTGNFTGASTGPGLNSNPSLFDSNEPTGGYRQFPPVGGTNQDTLRTGRGYSAYIREGVNPTTLEVKGIPNQGTITYSLTPGTGPTDGYNLVGNPYAAPVKWTGSSTGGWTMSGVNNTVSVRENYSATEYRFRTWNGTSGNLANGIIAPGQAYWVQTTNGAPALSIGETAKQTTDATFYRDGAPENVIAVKMKAGNREDDAYIQFDRNASLVYEKQLDALKQSNSYFNLSTLTSDGRAVAINLTTTGDCEQIISFRTTNAAVGTYSLIVSGVTSLVSGEQVVFMDTFTNTTLTLGAEDYTHNFSITADAASKADGRFKLRFIKPGVSYDNNLVSETGCNDGDPVVWIKNSQAGVDYKAFLNGTTVSDVAVGTGTDLAIPIKHGMLPFGKTTLQLKAGFLGCQQFDLTNTVAVVRDSATAPEVKMNQGVISVSNFQGAAEYQWFLRGDSLTGVVGSEFTPVDSGAYTVQMKKGGCVLTSSTIDKHLLSLDLSMTSDKVCNNDASVILNGSQAGATYKAFFGSIGASSDVMGTGGPIIISLDPSVITTGPKDIKVQAGFENDIPQFLTQNIIVQRDILATPQIVVDGTKLKSSVSGASYKWYRDGQLISSDSEIDFSTEGAYIVEVTTGTCFSTSVSVPLSFTVRTDIATNSHSTCDKSLVTVQDSQPGVTYAAYLNGNIVSDEVTGTGDDITLTVIEALGLGQNQLTVKAGYLNSTKFDLKGTVMVERMFLAEPKVTADGNRLTVNVKDAQYAWYLNGEALPGETSSSIEPAEAGSYYVVISNGVCAKQSAPVEYSVTGLGDELVATLTVSPNPAKNRVIVKTPRPIELSSVSLSTATGQGFNVPTASLGDHSIEMDISELTAGFYLVHVNGQTIRLVKE